MKTISIAFGIHNHQPVGNFDFVLEEAYQKSYLPFLELLEKHPHIRMAQHYTGILFEWLKINKPTFIPLLRKLVQRNQIEMMTGGFYEPIMSVIPDRDKVGQVQKLNRFVKENTGYEPAGMWLAERIWEPHLPKCLAEAGVNYLVLDDSHFKNAGLKDEEMLGYFLTEEEGHTVFLFPIREKLRYTIPFEPPENTIEYLRSIATEDGEAVVVFADDGEKFGVWPNTYKHCFENGWLDNFFTVLEENSEWINIIHFSEAIERFQPLGRIYLPTASYREMMEWALPTRAISQYDDFEATLRQADMLDKNRMFVRGGFWRNFMVKYPESNNMHKKMLRLSKRLESLAAVHSAEDKFKRAQDHLWAGQCNCPYWHGVFGGLYLCHLRYATYHEFIQAERLLDEIEHPGESTGWLDIAETDFDCDGHGEVLVSNPQINLKIAPQRGGAIFELDFKPGAINIMDTMTRREESYHKKLVQAAQPAGKSKETVAEDSIASIHDLVVMKEEGLEKLLHYDNYRRMSCLDHFLEKKTTLTKFSQSKHVEAGDFIEQPFEYVLHKQDDNVAIKLRRLGEVATQNRRKASVLIEKTISVDSLSSCLLIHYSLTNNSQKTESFWFASEWDFALLAGDAPDRYFVFPGSKLKDARLRSSGEIASAGEARLVDEWLKVSISLKASEDCSFWRFPIETISQSEGGFERVYQSSVVLPNWKFELDAGATWQTDLVLEVAAL